MSDRDKEHSYQIRVILHDTPEYNAPTNKNVEIDVHRAFEHRLAAVTHGEISVRSERLDK
jgi:hypothetical protein